MPIGLNEYTEGLSNFKLLNHIFDDRDDLTPTEKLVATALLRHRNITTLACHPSMRRIRSITGLSMDTVRRAISGLESKRVVIVGRNYRGPRGRAVNRYVFTYDLEAALNAENMNLDLAEDEYKLIQGLYR